MILKRSCWQAGPLFCLESTHPACASRGTPFRLRQKERFLFSPRQQNSFGRNQAEQWWSVRLQGHSEPYLKRG